MPSPDHPANAEGSGEGDDVWQQEGRLQRRQEAVYPLPMPSLPLAPVPVISSPVANGKIASG